LAAGGKRKQPFCRGYQDIYDLSWGQNKKRVIYGTHSHLLLKPTRKLKCSIQCHARVFIIHKIRQKPRDTREQLGSPHEYSQKGSTRCASTHRHCYNTATTEIASAHTGCTYSMRGNVVDLRGVFQNLLNLVLQRPLLLLAGFTRWGAQTKEAVCGLATFMAGSGYPSGSRADCAAPDSSVECTQRLYQH